MGDPKPIPTFLNVVGLFKAFNFMALVWSYQLKGTTDKLVDTSFMHSVGNKISEEKQVSLLRRLHTAF